MLQLTCNNYLIIGASSDLGVECVKAISSKNGEAVIVAHCNSNRVVLEELRNTGINIKIVQANLSDPNAIQQLIKEIEEAGYLPNYIISFAAVPYRFTRLTDWKTERIKKDLQVQVMSVAEICKAFVPKMADTGFGRVVFMLSSCTLNTPPKSLFEYTTVKYALFGFMKSLAEEYKDQGVNVNAVSPAMINTKFTKNIGRRIKEISAEKNPRHRNLDPKDVIPSIMFLLSDEAEFINGVNLDLSLGQ